MTLWDIIFSDKRENKVRFGPFFLYDFSLLYVLCVKKSYLELHSYLVSIRDLLRTQGDRYPEDGGREGCRVQISVVDAGMCCPDLTVGTKDKYSYCWKGT